MTAAIAENTVEIQLNDGSHALVDECDADLAEFKWTASTRKHGLAYAYRHAKREDGHWQTVYLHRAVLFRFREIPQGDVVDHINGNGLDCRRSNLRPATKTQNHATRRLQSRRSGGLKGVTFDKRREKWQARVVRNGVQTSLGYFTTPEEAHQCYCDAMVAMHGEYANTAGAHDRA